MRALWRALTLVAVVAVAASCGKDSTGPVGAGRFTGTLSGAETGTKSGTAYYEVSESGTGFGLFGFSSDEELEFDFFPHTASDGMPATGTYTMGATDEEYASVVYVGDNEYGSTGGTLTITSATATAVKGSFNITYDGSGGDLVFTGTFNASRCPDC